MVKKIVFLIVITLVYSPILASDRDKVAASARVKNEQFLYNSFRLDDLIKNAIQNYKAEIVRIYPMFTDEILKKDFSDIFLNAETKFRESYLKAFKVYSDEELEKLVKHYDSEIGRWLIKKEIEFNRNAQEQFDAEYQKLNDSFLKRLKSKKY